MDTYFELLLLLISVSANNWEHAPGVLCPSVDKVFQERTLGEELSRIVKLPGVTARYLISWLAWGKRKGGRIGLAFRGR